MTDARSSFGVLIKIGDGGSPTETFTTIAEVKDIAGPGMVADTEEVTHHSSTGGWKEKIVTLKDGGQITFPVNWLLQNATQSFTSGLLQDFVDGTLRNFQVVWTDVAPTTWTIPAFVVGFNPDAPVSGVLGSEITLEVTGQPTLA